MTRLPSPGATRQHVRADDTHLANWTTAGICALVTFAFRYAVFADFPDDHYVVLARAQQWLLGDWPVRDFVDPGIPLMTAVSVAGQWVMGPGLHSELILICCLYAVTSGALALGVSWTTGSWRLALLAVGIAMLAYPTPYSYPKYLTVTVAFAAAASGRLRWLAVTCGAAFLFRHDLGVIIGLAFLGGAVAAWRRAAWPKIVRFALVALATIAPFLFWVQWHDGLAAYVADGISFSQREGSTADWHPPRFELDLSAPLLGVTRPDPCRTVAYVRWADALNENDLTTLEARHDLRRRTQTGPMTWQYGVCNTSRAAVRALVNDPAVADTQNIDREHFVIPGARGALATRLQALVYRLTPGEGLRLQHNSVALLYYVMWIVPALALVLYVQRPPAGGAALAVALAIGAQVLMNVTMLRDPLDTRIRDPLAATALLLPWILMALKQRTHAALAVAKRAVVVVTLLLVVLASATVGSFKDRMEATDIVRGPSALWAHVREVGTNLAPPHERTGQLNPERQTLVNYVRSCTSQTSRVLYLGSTPDVVFHLGRGFAGSQPTLIPGIYMNERHMALLFRRLAGEDVPFAIANSETWQDVRRDFPRVAQHVDATFSEAARFEVSPGRTLIVFAEVGRPGTRRYGQTSLPCFS